MDQLARAVERIKKRQRPTQNPTKLRQAIASLAKRDLPVLPIIESDADLLRLSPDILVFVALICTLERQE